MSRADILESISQERDYQDEQRWGNEFDDKNTVNDWVVYANRYANMAASGARDPMEAFKKTAAICVAAMEAYERNGGFPPRHYDPQGE